MLTSADKAPRKPRAETGGEVRPLRFVGDDAALLEALKNGHPGAPALLYDRYCEYARCLLIRMLGNDGDTPDLLQDVFLGVLNSIHRLNDPAKTKAWVGSVSVNTARNHLRKRARGRWLRFAAPEALPPMGADHADHDSVEVLRLTYEILDLMPADERIPFVLRFMEGMELSEIADACRISVATTKRRISKAEKRFLSLAGSREPVYERVRLGTRWGAR